MPARAGGLRHGGPLPALRASPRGAAWSRAHGPATPRSRSRPSVLSDASIAASAAASVLVYAATRTDTPRATRASRCAVRAAVAAVTSASALSRCTMISSRSDPCVSDSAIERRSPARVSSPTTTTIACCRGCAAATAAAPPGFSSDPARESPSRAPVAMQTARCRARPRAASASRGRQQARRPLRDPAATPSTCTAST